MKRYGQPRKIVTDGLCSYSAAMKELGNADRHEVGGRLNNRAEFEVLDVLIQSKRNKRAALKLMRKLLKKYAFVPERLSEGEALDGLVASPPASTWDQLRLQWRRLAASVALSGSGGLATTMTKSPLPSRRKDVDRLQR